MRIPAVLWFLLGLLSIAAGCASLDGRGLVAGKSTATDVQAAMGAPAARIKYADGGEVLYFPRHPEGRVCYAVAVGPDGVMKAIEQRLNRENFGKLAVGKSTRDQVRELLGPPALIVHLRLKGMDAWEYPWLEIDEKRILYLQISADGIVRQADEVHDQFSDKPSLE